MNVGDAVAFTDPGVGPAALVRTGRNDVAAYSRICTHAGCEVGYDSSRQLFVCPCHGSQYSTSGQVVRGPAPASLTQFQTQFSNGVLTVG
jgi:cytochrome b6-f complex iron-sulfur subunit